MIMKKTTKILAGIILAAIFLSIFQVSASSTNEINVTIDGEQVYFNEAPFNDNGVAYVPLDEIFEAFGATVKYNTEDEKAAHRARTSADLADIQIRYRVLPVTKNQGRSNQYYINFL